MWYAGTLAYLRGAPQRGGNVRRDIRRLRVIGLSYSKPTCHGREGRSFVQGELCFRAKRRRESLPWGNSIVPFPWGRKWNDTTMSACCDLLNNPVIRGGVVMMGRRSAKIARVKGREDMKRGKTYGRIGKKLIMVRVACSCVRQKSLSLLAA